MDIIQTVASDAVANLAVGLIGLFTAYATYGIYRLAQKARAEIALLKSTTARQRLENAVADVELLATLTVGALEQTLAKDVREAVKLGKAGKFELNNIAAMAKSSIAAATTAEARHIIAEHFGSFNSFVDDLIEERVLSLKNARRSRRQIRGKL